MNLCFSRRAAGESGPVNNAHPHNAHPPRIFSPKSRGFSLVELLAVLIIMAILAVVAIPTYQSYLLRGHRTQARNALQAVATEMAQYRRANNRFGPIDLTPFQTKFYTVSFVSPPTDSTYEIQATAVNGQTKDVCQVFYLDQAGRESVQWKDGTKSGPREPHTNECWNG